MWFFSFMQNQFVVEQKCSEFFKIINTYGEILRFKSKWINLCDVYYKSRELCCIIRSKHKR